MKTTDLYQEAKDTDIPILILDIPKTGSMCMQSESGRCYIGMDYGVLPEESVRRVHLAHELGHCKTGAFYNRWAARDVRKKHENRADKWAVNKLIPVDELDQAVADGHTELWDLADHFGVTEEFMRKAVCWYTHGNLAAELYF
ncbi:ImmA/IrrE family metallo-endopeptidase [Flavonifractor sp. An112]|uniref:ImmA/IrrE family metallo-endopeptidase n=1 Tax=Flavonifractor sp. An112 TaxID=1965544 RepID=UPI00174CA1F6|nr:ImmA/IrrE family metallo-endopeptidase [Flavonifractor sp. An112]